MAKKTKFDESLWMNNATFQHYYNMLVEIALSRFEWKGLPDTCDARFMELALLTSGAAVFFRDEVMGYLTLRVLLNGPLNHYNLPVNRRAIGGNGYQVELNINDSVLVYNNYQRNPSIPSLKLYAKRLWNIDRIADVNCNAQKTPVLITCDDTQRLTMLNLYQQWDGNEPVIFGNKALQTTGVSVLKTDAPFVADKLYTYKVNIWNEILTYLGIANVGRDKKERLVSSEVTKMQGGTVACRYGPLEMRRKACEQINEMFGLDVQCDFRDEFGGEEVSQDGALYNGAEDDLRETSGV